MSTKQIMQGEIDNLKQLNQSLTQEISALKKDNQTFKKDNQQLRRDNTSLRQDNKTLLGIVDRNSCQAQQVYHYHEGSQSTINVNNKVKKQA